MARVRPRLQVTFDATQWHAVERAAAAAGARPAAWARDVLLRAAGAGASDPTVEARVRSALAELEALGPRRAKAGARTVRELGRARAAERWGERRDRQK